MIKDNNYYQISGWMLNDLKLKGVALSVYAIIYGFTQDGESEFSGSRQYLADFTGTTRPTIDKALKELVDKGYIFKETVTVNNVNFNKYRVKLPIIQDVKKLDRGCKETLQGCKETLHNNNTYNIDDNNSNKKKKILKKEKVEKVFEHWNSKKIIVHEKISEPIERAVDKFLDKHSVDETITAIDRYKKVIEDKNYFFSYKWSLTDFLNRKSGAVDFLDDGSKWNDYISKTNTINGKNKNGALSPDLQRALERLGGA